MYGILRITPITPEVIRISFVKGVTAKVQDTYWKPKADTAFPWSAKESKTAVLVETEKLRVMVEKKDGAVQFLTPDNKPILSEKRDEPRMIDGGMTWTFFDWSGSETVSYTHLEHSPEIDQIILVTGADKIEYCQKEIIEKYGIKKTVSVCAGGRERYESVWKALQTLKSLESEQDQKTDYVLIHDGARPFLNQEMLERLLSLIHS